ncbi:hypothetical protein AU193_01080 [Mycobacterium sp. GA-1285]|uniref:hypothetical protein n=1 Tax=Mycobacterium sp. GA-1285 TaxID=1772282 RepID=UPI00074609E0|nr:hypothetical protein [Mycobacterium sp. GA-1285]KUI23377.1 hypothetical protein AU193_01080 [Mycobacterium sp. GA-1285]
MRARVPVSPSPVSDIITTAAGFATAACAEVSASASVTERKSAGEPSCGTVEPVRRCAAFGKRVNAAAV